MGLKAWVGPLSWALTYCVVFGLISTGLAILCHTSFFSATSFSLLLAVILLFTMSQIAFAIMVRTTFQLAFLLWCLMKVSWEGASQQIHTLQSV